MLSAAGALLSRVPMWVWIGLAALVAFYFALDAYGDSRYREGKKDADAAWIKASDKLLKKAADAKTAADKAAAARDAEYAARVKDERERIDKATVEGTSPFDVLFGGQG